MKLYEYTGKELFKLFHIPVPKGILLANSNEIAKHFRPANEYFLKAQLLSGGRGKRGLVKSVTSLKEAEEVADELFQNEGVTYLLMEEKVDVKREFYFSLSLDETRGKIRLTFSEFGGVEVEAIHTDEKQSLHSFLFSYLDGLKDYQIITLLTKTKIEPHYYKEIVNVIKRAYALMVQIEATVVEINPLALTEDGKVIALDAKVEVDDSSLKRNNLLKHNISLNLYVNGSLKSEVEREAEEHGISYVELDGEIALLSGGAGITMAIIDAIHKHGGSAANFVDIASGSSIESLKKMSELIIKQAENDEAIRCVLINVIVSGTPLNVVTEAMASVIEQLKPKKPIVGSIRAAGLAVKQMSLTESHERFAKVGVKLFTEIEEAIKEAVNICKGG